MLFKEFLTISVKNDLTDSKARNKMLLRAMDFISVQNKNNTDQFRCNRALK